jgi:RNA polymerase sigma-70 factor (ECF subfamily)
VRDGETSRLFDALLLARARAGDRRAAGRLAARWQPRLLRAARRILRSEEGAREAAQETWGGICRNWMTLSDAHAFPAFAFRILHRRCADQLRAHYRRAPEDMYTELDGATPASAETSTALVRAFDSLPEEQRAAATLFFVENLTLAEIAVAVGVSVGTVKSRVFHARRRLKAALSGE